MDNPMTDDPVALARELRASADNLALQISDIYDPDAADVDLMRKVAAYLESLSAPVEDEEKVCCEILGKRYEAHGFTEWEVCNLFDQCEITAILEAMREYARRLRASHPVGVTEWQPIETAPKDGSEVIGVSVREIGDKVYRYGPWTMAFGGRTKKEWHPSWDGSTVIEHMSDFGTEDKSLDMEPTHWAPLPASTTTEDEALGRSMK